MPWLELTEDEVNDLANYVDSSIEDWLNARDCKPFGSDAWRYAHEMIVFYIFLYYKMGGSYGDMRVGEW